MAKTLTSFIKGTASPPLRQQQQQIASVFPLHTPNRDGGRTKRAAQHQMSSGKITSTADIRQVWLNNWSIDEEFIYIEMMSWIGANVWVMLKNSDGIWLKAKVIRVDSAISKWIFDVDVDELGHHSIETIPIDSFQLEFECVKRREIDYTSASAGSIFDYAKVSDMTSLTFLNEPEIIECLRRRYELDLIYTATGPILVAVNPYKYLPVYDETVLELYFEEGASLGSPSSRLPPHVFQISDNAYRRMFVDKFDPDKRENQSILVNGESGAGKTESTKHCLHYLAVVSSKVASCLGLGSESSDIENKILASNPITESLGNAKTSRNNNSSRFGKYIELGYSADGVIENASIYTYLLESVRVVSHVQGERNFHIFYEIAASLPGEELQQIGFGDMRDFLYLHNGGVSPDPTEAELDMYVENYNAFREALDIMEVPENMQESLILVVIAVLHIGNLTFVESDVAGEEAALFSEHAQANHVKYICNLLSISEESLLTAVGRRSMSVAGSTTTKQLSVSGAMHAKDNFARTIYNCLFTWMLTAVNEELNTVSADVDVVSHIGILDIFGFEFFETNSFEQLCINYTNEKLQEHFNNSVFRTEQELYRAEGIQWMFVNYPDNSSRLDLLENRRNGIFALCDERLKLKATVSHEVLAKDLYGKCSGSPFFVAEAGHRRKHQFVMKHFAGDVLYSTELFLEKNRSEVAPELTSCLRNSTSPFVRQLAETFEDLEEVFNSQQNRPPSLRLGAAAGVRGSGQYSPLRSAYSDGGISMERRLSPRRQSPRGGAATPFKTPLKASATSTLQNNPIENKVAAPSGSTAISPLGAAAGAGYSRSASTGLGTATRGVLQAGQSPKLMPLRRKRLHTVLSQFTKQLQELMDSIKKTRSHFIRCIKPNELMSPCSYDAKLVMAQLRCGGVQGAIQVFRAGFPNRFEFSFFIAKYSAIAFACGRNSLTADFYQLRSRAASTEHDVYWKACCQALLRIVPIADSVLTVLGIKSPRSVSSQGSGEINASSNDASGGGDMGVDIVDVDTMIALSTNTATQDVSSSGRSTSAHQDDMAQIIAEGMCMGRTQVFLRAQVFDYLEQLHLRARTLIATVLQRRWHSYQEVKARLLEMQMADDKTPGVSARAAKTGKVLKRSRSSAIRIAMSVDSFTDKRRRTAIHITAAVIIIQRRCRVIVACRRLRLARFLSTWTAAHYRGALARASVRLMRNKMATIIQALWRAKLRRNEYVLLRSGALKVQQWVRRIRQRLQTRRDLALKVQADWTALKLQSLWRRKSARRATISLATARDEARREQAAKDQARREKLLNRVLDKFDAHPGLLEALCTTSNDMIDTIVHGNPLTQKVDKSTFAGDAIDDVIGDADGQEQKYADGYIDSAGIDRTAVCSPLHSGTSASQTDPKYVQELEEKIAHLQKELQAKNKCCFGFC